MNLEMDKDVNKQNNTLANIKINLFLVKDCTENNID